MDKISLHKAISTALQILSQNAINAANQAHDTATNKESVAENKYDTFGLEASYLAHGQAKRVEECRHDLELFSAINVTDFNQQDAINLGALVQVDSDKCSKQYLFLSPSAGGVGLRVDNREITLITPSSPLGKALLGCYVGDEILVQGTCYEVISVI